MEAAQRGVKKVEKKVLTNTEDLEMIQKCADEKESGSERNATDACPGFQSVRQKVVVSIATTRFLDRFDE